MESVKQKIKQAFESCYGLSCKKNDINVVKLEFDELGYEIVKFTVSGKMVLWAYFSYEKSVYIIG